MKISSLLFFIILLFSNCQYFHLMPYKEWKESAEYEFETVVYTAGIYFDGAQQTACYWKNGERFSLDGNTVGAQAWARSIYVINEDVYVGGSYHTALSPQACYWKNGKFQEIQLDYPGNPSRVESIFALNGIVFMAGYEYDGSNKEACFWINDIKYSLYATHPSLALSIYVVQNSSSKHKIYIAGSNSPSGNNEACYWINEGSNIISSGIDNTEAQSIFVYGDKIYTAGHIDGTLPPPDITCYWENNNLDFSYTMPDNCFETYIFITTNGDIHLAAYASNPDGYYWKNGKLKYVKTNSEVHSIYVFNDDAYLAGNTWDIMTGWRAAYWKDPNKPILVDDKENSGSCIYSIFVTSDK